MASGFIPSSGGGMDLLWTNPSPSANFGAQTLNINLSAYQAVMIVPKFGTGSGSMRKGAFLRKGMTTACFEPDTGGKYIARNITVNTNNIVFENGSNNGTASSAHWIPMYIYGIK